MTKKQLKAKRKDLSLSQLALAKKAKVSRYNISLFENGHRKLTLMERRLIETAINIVEEKICST